MSTARSFRCSAAADTSAQSGTAAPVRAGDTVWCPPGERHWHGAAADSFMTHTAISLGKTAWAEAVSQQDYVS